MTLYIQQQLKKLCDNPNWYDDYVHLESQEINLISTTTAIKQI